MPPRGCFRESWRVLRCWLLFAAYAFCLQISQGLDPSKAISQYYLDVWTERDGLPQGSVQAIVQTSDGYLWIGTRDGLARFDGVSFTVFRSEDHPGLESNDIRCLREDSRRRLWIGTFNGGASCLESGEFRAVTSRDGLPGPGVLDIFEDREHRIWFGTWDGVALLENGKIRAFRGGGALTGKNGWSISQDKEGTVWVATGGGLNRYDGSAFRQEHSMPEGLRTGAFRKILFDKTGALWIATMGGGIRKGENGSCSYFTTEQGLGDNNVQCLLEDRAGNVWAATWRGLSRFENGRWSTFRRRQGLPHEHLETLYEDREGSLWIGTRGGGLARLKDAKFAVFTTQQGLADNFPKAVFEASDGAVWVSSNGGGLSRFEKGAFHTYDMGDGLPSPFIWSITEDKGHRIWAGSSRPPALCTFDGKKFVRFAQPLKIEQGIRALFCDSKGDLWVGGDGGGLAVLRGDALQYYGRKDGLPSELIRVIAEDREGNLWIGTNQGLCRMRDGQFAAYSTKDGLAHEAVYSVHQTADGVLWFGTQGGLSKFENGRLTSYKTRDGLAQSFVYQILEDEGGTLWMSGNRGIFSLTREAIRQFDCKKASRLSCATFDVADGMRSSQCEGGTQPSGCRTREGRLWFPTASGIATVNPSQMHRNDQPPPVLVEEVFVANEPISPRALAQLPPGSRDFRFHYTALSFLAPEKVRFKYKLEGLDADWVDAGSRRVAFYNEIPPGAYRFRVRACNNDGVWNEEGAVFAFSLLPHLYQNVWFYVACALLVGAGGWTFHRSRMERAKAGFSAVLQERGRIARDLHDTLAQGFAGIAFQLEAVSDHLSKTPAEAQRHLTLALSMVRHSLGEAKRSVMNLRSPEFQSGQLVQALIETARQLTLGRSIDLDVQAPDAFAPLPAKVEAELLRIGQEAITNALKHGHPSKLTILFRQDTAGTTLAIGDNGAGFDPAKGPSDQEPHFGLLGMRERARQIGASLKVSSHPGSGTRIEVFSPSHESR